jgi:hypothetical protein
MGLISDTIATEDKASKPGPGCTTGKLLDSLTKKDRAELEAWLEGDTRGSVIVRALAKIGKDKLDAGDDTGKLWQIRPESLRRHRSSVKGTESNPCWCVRG